MAELDLSPLAIQTILAKCLTDEKVFLKWWGLLTPEFFADPSYRKLADFIEVFFKRYGTPPTFETIITTFSSDDIAESERVVFETILEDLVTAPLTDFPYYEDQLAVLIKRRAFDGALIKAEAAVQRNEFDAAVNVLSEANLVATEHNLGSMFFEAGEVENRFQRRTDPLQHLGHIAMNIGGLDRYLEGGIKANTLTTLIGASGFGKSMGLIHAAKQAVIQGYKVLYVTLEMTREDVEDRFDASLTGLQTNYLRDHAGEAYRLLTEQWGQYGSSLRIIEYPELSLSVEQLDAILNRLHKEFNFKADMVVVDYADLLAPPKGLEKRHALGFIYVYLHRIAKVHKCRVITASQTNRSGISRAIVTMTDLAEDISKAWSSDYIFTICQTPEEQNANQARLFIAKQRGGIKFKEIKFAQDFSRAQFALGSMTSTARTVTPSELEEGGLSDDQPFGPQPIIPDAAESSAESVSTNS